MTEVELDLADYHQILAWHTLAFAKGHKQSKADEKVYRKIVTMKEAEEDFLKSLKDD